MTRLNPARPIRAQTRKPAFFVRRASPSSTQAPSELRSRSTHKSVRDLFESPGASKPLTLLAPPDALDSFVAHDFSALQSRTPNRPQLGYFKDSDALYFKSAMRRLSREPLKQGGMTPDSARMAVIVAEASLAASRKERDLGVGGMELAKRKIDRSEVVTEPVFVNGAVPQSPMEGEITRLYGQLEVIILDSKVNPAELQKDMRLNWRIGKEIHDCAKNLCEHESHFLDVLAKRLSERFPTPYSRDDLQNMLDFYEMYPDSEYVKRLVDRLSWKRCQMLIKIDHRGQRDFYTEMAYRGSWTDEVLAQKIRSMLYERTDFSHRPAAEVEGIIASFRDPTALLPIEVMLRNVYDLSFLGLPADYRDYHEVPDLEAAIIANMKPFMDELGPGFNFEAQQQSILRQGRRVGRMDLLFFNRKLRRLIVVELKAEPLKRDDVFQALDYLKELRAHEMHEGDHPPIAIILCPDCTSDDIEHFEVNRVGSPIWVAKYLTALPDRDALAQLLKKPVNPLDLPSDPSKI